MIYLYLTVIQSLLHNLTVSVDSTDSAVSVKLLLVTISDLRIRVASEISDCSIDIFHKSLVAGHWDDLTVTPTGPILMFVDSGVIVGVLVFQQEFPTDIPGLDFGLDISPNHLHIMVEIGYDYLIYGCSDTVHPFLTVPYLSHDLMIDGFGKLNGSVEFPFPPYLIIGCEKYPFVIDPGAIVGFKILDCPFFCLFLTCDFGFADRFLTDRMFIGMFKLNDLNRNLTGLCESDGCGSSAFLFGSGCSLCHIINPNL